MLMQLSAYKDSTIVRTRYPVQLAKCEFWVNIGGKEDAETDDVDHHQRGFTRVMAKYNRSTNLSSAGLVYTTLGPEIVRAILGSDPAVLRLQHFASMLIQMLWSR